MPILVTGGAGYIGSHSVLDLVKAGYEELVVYDNLQNSTEAPLNRIMTMTGGKITFVRGDIRDETKLDETLTTYAIDKIIHFAGLKAVGESVANPLLYYDNNVNGTLTLLQAAKKRRIRHFIFSSSATVYGTPESLPIDELALTGGVTNPYGKTKLHIEEMLKDVCVSDPNFKVIALRYFNAAGAHESGQLGEEPKGLPNNLMPYLAQVAVGRLDKLMVFGNDYDTADGTGVRDYIHVMDLAEGHTCAIRKMDEVPSGFHAINLGTGIGYSVLDMINAFSTASGKNIKYEIESRRAGDISSCYASAAKAKIMLDWSAKRDIHEICRDAWNWQVNNPYGYSNS